MGNYTIYRVSSGGVGGEGVFVKDGVILNDWSLNGEYIAGQRFGKRSDLWIVPLTGDRKPYPFLQSEFYEFQAVFSPDTK
jgi:eukaryotic-like serine/threonine-protein kinase